MPEALDQSIVVTLPDGTPYAGKYELRLGECTGLDDLDIRRETGMTLWGLIGSLGEEGGLSLVLAGVVAWIVRRRSFPHLTYADVARSVTWGSDFEVVWNSEEDEGEEQGSEPATPKSSEPSPTSTKSARGKSTG